MSNLLLVIIFIIMNIGFWFEMKYIMELGKREIIVTLLFSNGILVLAAILQNEYIAYAILGFGLVVSIVYSTVKEFKKRS